MATQIVDAMKTVVDGLHTKIGQLTQGDSVIVERYSRKPEGINERGQYSICIYPVEVVPTPVTSRSDYYTIRISVMIMYIMETQTTASEPSLEDQYGDFLDKVNEIYDGIHHLEIGHTTVALGTIQFPEVRIVNETVFSSNIEMEYNVYRSTNR